MNKLETDTWWPVVVGIALFYMGVIGLGLAIVDASLPGVIAAVVVLLIGILTPILSYYLPLHDQRRKQLRLARRQAALAGDTSVVPIAESQPRPNGEALPLPCTIETRPNWLTIIPACGLAALALWVFLRVSFFKALIHLGYQDSFPSSSSWLFCSLAS